MRGLCRFPTSPGAAATIGLRQSRSPCTAPGFSSPLEGGFLLFGTTSAQWTLHKLCTLVQSKLSICELSYLMLRMKTSKRGGWGILTEKKPMKIYWKYGKEINVLLYIDRIIFIKIHIHVQELAWSCVLCWSLLAGEGERRSRCRRLLVSPPRGDGAACLWAGGGRWCNDVPQLGRHQPWDPPLAGRSWALPNKGELAPG